MVLEIGREKESATALSVGVPDDNQGSRLCNVKDSETQTAFSHHAEGEGGVHSEDETQPSGFLSFAVAHLRKVVPFHEIESYQQEFSGMLGDLGLYIPLVIALSLSGQIGLGPTLIFSGLSNVITGLTFTVPMCVQPMKSISTVALSDGLTNSQIMASGILTSAIVFALGLSNLIVVVNQVIPDCVVRGLQLGLGLSLFKKAAALLPNNGKPSWDHGQWMQWDGLITAAFALAFAIVFVRSSKIPTALCLFLFGLGIAAIRFSAEDEHLHFGLTSMALVTFETGDWAVGMVQGALPQIPTTIINSVIAVCRLAEDLYPERATGVTVRRVATSVGGMNLLFCWFGGLPMCHGAGGLAGQHRFGARTNLSILVLGACKVVLGLCFSRGILQLLQLFPGGVLASMLAVSGFELASAARTALTSPDPDRVRLCLLTACFTLFFGTAVGFSAGMLASAIVFLSSTVIGPDESVKQARSTLHKAWSDSKAWWQSKMGERRGESSQHGSEPGSAVPLVDTGSVYSAAGSAGAVVTSLSRRQPGSAPAGEDRMQAGPSCC